jgi:hypothetical protein
MSTYRLTVKGNSTPSGTITATFVAATSTVSGKLTGFSYANDSGTAQLHNDIDLGFPDPVSGDYSVDKQFNRDFTVTGHRAHRHIKFKFNPNKTPQFFTGHLNDDPASDAGFEWTATQDTQHHHHK